jgi:hypothetical protein
LANTLYTELFGVLQSTTLSAARFNAKLIDRASDLINEDKLDETQAGLITLASKAALEIHKQIGKNIQSALFITMNLKRLFADFRILERTILS